MNWRCSDATLADRRLLSRKLFENVNSLFANESDGYKTTSAPSAFRFSCGRNARTGQESTPEQSECIETAIKKTYLTDVAAVIEDVQLQCFKAKPKKPHPQPIQRPSLTV